ncbi:hypothetical protein BGX26_000327 [Mortierella sp. AD094]|nr:hypothetical protein BGX26_000327 [Mortierella sp. AD094]
MTPLSSTRARSAKTKLKVKEIVANLNYTLGVLGSESRFLYGLQRQYPELRLENPWATVRTVHTHKSKERPKEWWDRVNYDGQSPERDLIAERLRKANFTESQILELKLHHEFIIICDGYDESQQTQNLYMSNRLYRPGEWRAQMVISCRTEYTGVEYKDCFQPTDRNRGGDAELFQQAIITPFTKEQIQDYIEQYVSLQKSPWGSDNYLKALEQIPNMQDLVKNPFLLKLALEVLPRLMKSNTEFSSTRIARLQLYDEFVAQWIDRGRTRLREMDLNPYDKATFKRLTDSGFQQRGIEYLKELVSAIYEYQNGNPVVNYSEYHDGRTWKEAYFSDRDERHLLREAIPLTRNGNQYRFIHKSLLEYGLSLAIFGPSKSNNDAEAAPSVSRRGSTTSVLSFECLSTTERTATADEQHLLDSPLGKRNLVGEPSIWQFLTERVQHEAVFKDQIHSVIERSKLNKSARIAAANAITILVRAGVQFMRADLRNIKIPGADLSFGMFDSAQLDGADLRKTNLRNIWMRQANLRGAQMNGVQFGELPFLQEDRAVVCCAYSPDGKIYATGLVNGEISLYETSRWDRILTLRGHGDTVNSLSFSATSDQIASGSSDSTVRLWDVDTGEYAHTLKGHSYYVESVVYSPKEDRIASGSRDCTVRLWDVDTGECVHTLQGHSHWVRSVVYSPKGDRIASGSDDSTVRLWDIETERCLCTVSDFSGSVISIALESDYEAQCLVTGSEDKSVRRWRITTDGDEH